MNERALEQLLDDLGRSLERLAAALAVRADEPLAIDGTIERFESTFEPFWWSGGRQITCFGDTDHAATKPLSG